MGAEVKALYDPPVRRVAINHFIERDEWAALVDYFGREAVFPWYAAGALGVG